MKGILIGLIMNLIDQLITDEVIEDAKKQLIEYLRGLAQKTDNQIDDKIVEIIAKAIG